jgi:Domain of unknown function (DUF4129)
MPRFAFNRPAVILSAIMLTALVAVATGAGQRFNPDWNRIPLIVVALVIALEAGFIQRTAHTHRLSLGEHLRFLAPEIVVLLVVMRIIATISIAGTNLSTAMQTWLYDPLKVIDPAFGLYVFLGLAISYFAHQTSRDIAILEPQAADEAHLRSNDHERFAAFLADERAAALSRIGTRFGGGGAILLIALSIEAINLADLGGLPAPLSTLSVIAALIYVVTGFLLHSRARLALLQSRWQIEGAHVARNVSQRWLLSSTLLVGGVLITAALLPHNYGTGILDTLRNMLAIVGYAFSIIGYAVTWLFGMLLMLPAMLLSMMIPSGGSLPPPAPFQPPPAPVPTENPEYRPAILFWLCVIVLATLALRVILQRHPRLLRRIIVAWYRFWRSLRRLWNGTTQYAGILFSAIQSPFRTDPAIQARRTPAARLDPYGRVIRYYRSTTDDAGSIGHPRAKGQTPHEYYQSLAQRIPETDPDFADLTAAYTRARYAPQPITPADAQRVRQPWQRLRKLLRAQRTIRQTK